MAHGAVDGSGRYIKYEDESEKLRMGGGSWTINLDEITRKVRTVHFITATHIYSITLAKARQSGFVKVLGGENKLIVPVKHWRVQEKNAKVKKSA